MGVCVRVCVWDVCVRVEGDVCVWDVWMRAQACVCVGCVCVRGGG